MEKAHLTYEVPYADTDQMGVVYYANYLVYFERVRTRLLQNIGYPYQEMENNGFGLPVLEAHVEYRSPAHYGEILDIYGSVSSVKGARLQIDCEVMHDGRLLACGYTIHVCVDLASKRPRRLPERMLSLLPSAIEKEEEG